METNRSLTVKPNGEEGLMHVDVDMAQRQPNPPLSLIHQSRNVGTEYADHLEAATWNGPAHAD